METKDIIIFAVILLAAGFNLYRRYMKKKAGEDNGSTGTPGAKGSFSGNNDDDYEPYSGRRNN
ncbi:MAG: FeoB-associated Cys-rich membrane protein [Bacteroidales bacterium]|nr:FeoB-associated Cys-rich membrane protein [Bacteroidales bacterium]